MTPTRQGSFRLFRLLGIDVHVHWSWFVVAFYALSSPAKYYDSQVWDVLEYLSLFLIVLLHEFGHSLACRQVGGKSDQIVLWPLGGVAYVEPPLRPGANLWSIAAGPLVNVALLPVLYGLVFASNQFGGWPQHPNVYNLLCVIAALNFKLLLFNLLPVYPLDGGQILQSLLWYFIGRARSLMVATIIGFIGGVALLGMVFWFRAYYWYAFIGLFLLANCWQSFRYAKALRQLENLPRRREFACPSCHVAPPVGHYWLCPSCRQAFDPFATGSVCPHCSAVLGLITCPDCGEARAQRAWDASIRDA